jgi:hypothetical protein
VGVPAFTADGRPARCGDHFEEKGKPTRTIEVKAEVRDVMADHGYQRLAGIR